MSSDDLLRQVQEDAAMLERYHAELFAEQKAALQRISELRKLEIKIQRQRAAITTSNRGKSDDVLHDRLAKIREKMDELDRFKRISETVSPRKKKVFR